MRILDRDFLTFDDVLLVPQFNEIASRAHTDLTTRIGSRELALPIISANMDTITGKEMFEAMRDLGGWAYLHRFADLNTRYKWALQGYPVTVGVGKTDFDLVRDLGCRMSPKISEFCVDIAHGDSRAAMNMVSFIRECIPDANICAGNVVTRFGAERLLNAGANIIKVGVGPGSVCTTRTVTGHGMPQLTAIMDVAVVTRNRGASLIADGGIRSSGDIVKALAAGADAVMVGGLLSGCLETPAETIETADGVFKVFRGMASKEAYALNPDRKSKHKTAEGINTMVPSNGPIAEVIEELMGGVRSGLTYSGALSLPALRMKAQFARVTPMSLAESGTRL